ncbi:MAG: ArgR family transcriptional regulator [Paludibacteraceae bacterium]|nr:ArgR family transcriptional regulator [Paludibacteraceae bacterium]MBP6284899.1 ArgR family transcriptional regulator [Paludibacteraceae bacterium]
MKTRNKRLEAIKKIISNSSISSQEELLEAILSMGFSVTQATLSRDLKQLKITKILTEGGIYEYVIPFTNYANKAASNNREIISIEFSGQLAVIKTRAGYANGIASDIDLQISELILGTIAGDDTILLIPKENVSRDEIRIAMRAFVSFIS